MTLRTVRMDDFSGGLVTSVDESMLPLPCTAYARNVDFLDSRGITRRAGYSCMTPTAIQSGKEVKGIWRYYQTDGDKYWVVLAGTAVWTNGGAPRSQSRKELTASTVSGTCADISRPYYSGGNAVVVSGTSGVVATLPSSNWLSFKAYDTAGSYKLNAGSFVSITATVTTVATPSGSVTSLTVKPRVRNALGGRVLKTVSGLSQASRSRSVSTCSRKSIAVYSPSTSVDRYVRPATDASAVRLNSGGLGAVRVGATYISALPSGWHTLAFEWDATSTRYYLGATLIHTQNAITSGTLTAWTAYSYPLYLDTYRIDDALVDDFATVSASWTVTGTMTTCGTYDSQKSLTLDYIDNALTTAWTKQDGTISGTANYLGAVTLNDKAYYGTAYDNFRSYNGSTTATVSASGSAAGAFVVEHKRRLFASGLYSDPSLVYYSDLDKPENWNGGGSLRLVGKDSGGNATGLAVWDNRILAFFSSRVHTLDTTGDPSNWVNYALTNKYGTNAPKSIAVAPNGVVFLASDKSVKMFGLSSELGDSEGFMTLSEAIRPTLASIPDAMVPKAAGAVWRDRYWLSCCTTTGATHNDTMLVYRFPDSEQKLPGAWTWYDSHAFSTLYVTRGDEPMLVAGGYDGKLYQLDLGTDDNGAAIAMTYRTAPTAPGGYQQVKHFRHLHLSADSGGASQSLTVTPTTDDVDGTAQTVTLTSDTDIQPVRLAMPARGRSIQYTLTSSGAGQPATVNSLAVVYNGPKQR